MNRKRQVLNEIIIEKGDSIALENRRLIEESGVRALNLIGSPGCGKTTLLERTISELHGSAPPVRVGVIEGDVQSTIDRDRIAAAGAPATQIETQGACRLDAAMVSRALPDLSLDEIDLLVIENVGNLICPTGPKLGEHVKVVAISIPEGDEKPAKYPAAFVRADAVVVTKLDLLQHLDYDLGRALDDCRKLNNDIKAFPLSAVTGEGMDDWIEYLRTLADTGTRG
jgi:hydrogenase nickel incorporation protein HypB